MLSCKRHRSHSPQNRWFDMNVHKFVSDDVFKHICLFLNKTSIMQLVGVSHRHMKLCLPLLLSATISVTYNTIQRYALDSHRKLVQNLDLTSAHLTSNSELMNMCHLRRLYVTFDSRHNLQCIQLMNFLQQPHTSLQDLTIQKYLNVNTDTNQSYMLPLSLQRLVLKGYCAMFAIQHLTNLVHLRLPNRIADDDMTHQSLLFTMLDDLPSSVRFLEVDLRPFYSIHCKELIINPKKVVNNNVESICINLAGATKSVILIASFLARFQNVVNVKLHEFVGFGGYKPCNFGLTLPETVTELELNVGYGYVADFIDATFPNNLKTLRISSDHTSTSWMFKCYLPVHLTTLDLCDSPYVKPDPCSFGRSLKILHLGSDFDFMLDPGVLPDSLETLTFGKICMRGKFNRPFVVGALPPNLTTLILSRSFNQHLKEGILPPCLTTLRLGYAFEHCSTTYFPLGLLYLTLPRLKNTYTLPKKLKRLVTNSKCILQLSLYCGTIPDGCDVYTNMCWERAICSSSCDAYRIQTFHERVCPCKFRN